MSDTVERQHKLQVLLRLRELEGHAAAIEHARAQLKQQQKGQMFEVQRRHYEGAYQDAVGLCNPDLHSWRLVSLDLLRARVLKAEGELQDATDERRLAQQALSECEVRKKVAEQAYDTATLAVEAEILHRQVGEWLDLQIFRRRGRYEQD